MIDNLHLKTSGSYIVRDKRGTYMSGYSQQLGESQGSCVGPSIAQSALKEFFIFAKQKVSLRKNSKVIWLTLLKSNLISCCVANGNRSCCEPNREARFCIHLASNSFGDNLAWIPQVEEFRRVHTNVRWMCKYLCAWWILLNPLILFCALSLKKGRLQPLITTALLDEKGAVDPAKLSKERVTILLTV